VKKTLLKSMMIGVTGLMLVGCTYKNATISYKPYNAFSETEGGNLKYKEIAPISACSSGFVWDNCAKLTQQTLQKLQEQAKVLGGNGIINVKWSYRGNFVLTPTCKEQYGWFLAYILPGFGPWVQRSCAEGVAVKFLDKNISKNTLKERY